MSISSELTIKALGAIYLILYYLGFLTETLAPGALSCCHPLLSRLSLMRQCFGGIFKHSYLKMKEMVNQMRVLIKYVIMYMKNYRNICHENDF